MDSTLSIVADLICEAKQILFITGAGVSADSGLPTYRGIGGLYNDNYTQEGIPIEEALSGPMFMRRPEITWKYLWQIGSACQHASFNRAHEVIAAIEQKRPNSWVLTQNIDGFHRSAGSKNLIEIHGDAFDLYCMECSSSYDAHQLFGKDADSISLPPRCNQCNGVIRPKVVLFGEMLPTKEVGRLYQLAGLDLDLVITIGTSAVFPYIVEPVIQASRSGIPTVEVNPSQTEISSYVDHRIETGAAEAFGQLWEMIQDKI
ncbi:MAG: NAD-dependent deacylase [SAR324 cluster bacterium]|nr:NAD-dependent deacylase [SAR324 cluster bacterium]